MWRRRSFRFTTCERRRRIFCMISYPSQRCALIRLGSLFSRGRTSPVQKKRRRESREIRTMTTTKKKQHVVPSREYGGDDSAAYATLPELQPSFNWNTAGAMEKTTLSIFKLRIATLSNNNTTRDTLLLLPVPQLCLDLVVFFYRNGRNTSGHGHGYKAAYITGDKSNTLQSNIIYS